MVAASRLPVDRGATATEMAQEIFGDGVTVVNATYTGDKNSSGIYSNGDAISPEVTPSDTGVILSTGSVRDFTNRKGEANQNANTTTDTDGVDNDPLFNAAAGAQTFDAAYLDVDFVPTESVMTMQFVFSSEEYPEFASSEFQDFVGIWVNGVQIPLSIGDGDADPGNINGTNNENLYVDNTNSDFNTEMDGFTLTMTAKMPVIPGQVNSIRIGIADVADANYDSNLLIAAGSLQTSIVAVADTDTVALGAAKTIDVLANDIDNGTGGLFVTHINGVAVTAGDSVTLATGQIITLNPDGTLTAQADNDIEAVSFTYTAANGAGASDTAYVTLGQVPCFVSGTPVDTEDGVWPVEALVPGDMVLTRDMGPQPLRWIGQRTVVATDALAPIRIRAGTFGACEDVLVSPQHRVLVADPAAELLFDAPEVLVPATFLAESGFAQRVDGGHVTYVHLMFDSHQVLTTAGLPSESFLPGPQATDLLDTAALDELRLLFPDIDLATGDGYGMAARRTLRAFEAKLLLRYMGSAAGGALAA